MVLLSTAYFPPISYMAALVQQRNGYIDVDEPFVKQSYRNRCVIYGPNGAQALTVPLVRSDWRNPLNTIRISYAENWIDNHWRALLSAYNKSPFFAVLSDDIKRVFDQKPETLVMLNQLILDCILDWLQDADLLTSAAPNPTESIDLRQRISPKQKSLLLNPAPYYQQFAHKHGFIADLSVLDLLAHEGRLAWDYLNEAPLAWD